MKKHNDIHEPDAPCGCGCDSSCDRRDFLASVGAAASAMTLTSLTPETGADTSQTSEKRQGATVRVAFLYPPSRTFANDPNGWWSWPGNEFDAEGRQKEYTAALRDMEIKAETIIKGTKVSGIYSADPERQADATFFAEITYFEVIEKGLKVMDTTAISLCMDNNMPIMVFNIRGKGNIKKIAKGSTVGTFIGEE